MEVPHLNKSVLATTLVLAILLAEAQLLVPSALSQTSGSPKQPQWWNTQYTYRRQITVVDNTAHPMTNQTVMVHLSFSSNQAVDPQTSFRLVDNKGKEMPSVVVGGHYSGVFLASAYLLFLADIPANSNSSYYLYYGGGLRALPPYRALTPLRSLGTDLVTAQPGPATLDASNLQIIFGNVYTETIISKVLYVEGGTQEYGPAQISASPFSGDTGWLMAGSLNASISVAFDILEAGSVQLTEILLVGPSSAVTTNAVANGGSTEVTALDLTSVIGLGGLSVLSPTQSLYDANTGLLSSQTPGVSFGVKSSPTPSSFSLGSQQEVLSEAADDSFRGVSSQSGDSAAGFTWGLGDLPPAAAAWVSSDWSAATKISGLSLGSILVPVGARLGPEEVLNAATPVAKSLWSTNVTITSVTVPASGLTIPFALSGGSFVGGMTAITGSYSYSVPPAFSADPGAWTIASSSTGNGTAFASPDYYAFDLGKYVGRLSGYVPDGLSTVETSLRSLSYITYGGPSATLEIQYRASYSVRRGNFSAQDFFIAADIDPTMRNNYNESVFLPVAGSSTNMPTSGCQSSVSNFGSGTKEIWGTYLVGDNTWRTLSLSLPSNLPKQGFNVRIRSCISSLPGFSGIMQLDVLAAKVVLKGPASSIFQTSLSYASPVAVIVYLPQAAHLSSVGVRANLTLDLSLQANSRINWADGADFSGRISPPQSFSLNKSAILRAEALAPLHLEGVLVNSAVAGLAEMSSVNEIRVHDSPSSGSVFLHTANLSTGTPLTSYTVGLASRPVEVTVLDRNGHGVPGAQVFPTVEGTSIPGSYFTDTSGGVRLELVSWSFQIAASFQGNKVGSDSIDVGNQTSLSIGANVYSITASVLDSHNHPFAGAVITLTIGNYSISGETDSRGLYSFHAVGNGIYNATVSFGGQVYFSGSIGAAANNVVVVLATSYLPQTFQLIVVALAAIVPISGVVAYYVAKRLKKPR